MVKQLKTNIFSFMKAAKSKAIQSNQPLIFTYIEKIPIVHLLEEFTQAIKFQGERFFWQDIDNQIKLLGLGVAERIQQQQYQANRFTELAAKWQSYKHYQAGVENISGTGAICFGGFSFAENKQDGSLWQDYGSYLFVVPKYLLTEVNGDCYVTLNMVIEPLTSEPEMQNVLTEYEDFLNKYENLLTQKKAREFLPKCQSYNEVEVQAWRQSVSKALELIKQNDLKKIVLARQLKLNFSEKISVGEVLKNLSSQQTGNYLFCLENNSSSFVGASPERLIRKQNNQVVTACVAGTAKRGKTVADDERFGQELLDDSKNLKEHQFVVEEIGAKMKLLCESVRIDDKPRLMKNRQIQHLFTAIDGVSRKEVSILHFVEQLHPTPAMGGVPTEAAMISIQMFEQFDRGFYAAPLGWMDKDGNGEFFIGIRSGLIQEKEATLFAGCGIVTDSDINKEYLETRLKFQPMIQAMGGECID